MKIKILILLVLSTLFLLGATTYKTSAEKPTTSFTTFQITNEGHQQNGPLIWEDTVVWTDWRGSEGLDIWKYDLKNNQESLLISKPGHQAAYGIWKNKVVYRDESTTPATMRVYNIDTGEDVEIASGDTVVGGAIFGDKAFYVVGTAGGDLYVYDLITNESHYLTNNVYAPKVWGNKIVWTIHKGGGYYAIKGYDLDSENLFDISSSSTGSQSSPDIFGDDVVWIDNQDSGEYKLMFKNLSSGEEKAIYQTSTSLIGRPTISNHYIAWVDTRGDRNGADGIPQDIFVANRQSGEITELTNGGIQQVSPVAPDIYKNTVVWMYWNTGNGDIYGAEIRH